MTPVGILAVQGDFQAHGKALDRLGTAWRFVKKPSELNGLSGLILPGGESTTFLKFLQEEAWFEPIRRFASSRPVFGTCAGAILLAEKVENPSQDSLGLLHVTVRRNGYGRQLSSSVQTVEAEPELQIGPEAGTPLEAVLIRAPVILRAAPQVRVLARLHGQAVLVREGTVLAGTFHPELTSDSRVHRYFCGMIADGN
ncbi:MAG: pyridoxal 5'-phosphate synthase glutaminase subunit PdxT [Acidobacteriota bacterium]